MATSLGDARQELVDGALPDPTYQASTENPNPTLNVRTSSTSLSASAVSPSAATAASTPTSTPTTPVADDAVGKRGRRSKPKVKTGCTNCKQRRIKCDEKRPACTQCVRSSKVCTGYPPPPRSARPFEQLHLAPKPTPPQPAGTSPSTPGVLQRETVLPPRRIARRPRTVGAHSAPKEAGHILAPPVPQPTLYRPSLLIRFEPGEAQYFELFRARTGAELSGYFDNVFWTRRVLQECHNSAAIRHAVIALGALYKTLEESFWPAKGDLPDKARQTDSITTHWSVAVKKYSEACKAMALDGDNLSTHSRLMGTVLLVCFDSFIGDHKQAIIQIQTGLALMRQLASNTFELTGQCLATDGEDIEQELVMIFVRLVLQAQSYDLAFHFPQPYTITLPPAPWAPATPPSSSDRDTPSPPLIPHYSYNFKTICDARIEADKLNHSVCRYVRRLYTAQSEPRNVLPNHWQGSALDFVAQHEAWAAAFEPFLQARASPAFSPIERAAIVAVKIYQLTSQLLLVTLFYDTEDCFDEFFPHFRTMLDLAAELIREDEMIAASQRCPDRAECPHRRRPEWDPFNLADFTTYHVQPSFSADLGIVPPLFVVATKCRDPITRRQAIQLLKTSGRREAMWDSAMAAHIAEWIMTIEEADNDPLSLVGCYSERIPESNRIMIKSVDFDLRSRYAQVCVGTRAVRVGGQDDRYGETRINW